MSIKVELKSVATSKSKKNQNTSRVAHLATAAEFPKAGAAAACLAILSQINSPVDLVHHPVDLEEDSVDLEDGEKINGQRAICCLY